MMTSSWSRPLVSTPLGCVTPMTSKGTPLRPMRMVWPMGSALPKRFSTTVGPSTATRRDAWFSSASKNRPDARAKLRTANPSGVIPRTLVGAFWSSHRVASLLLVAGAAAATEGHSLAIASASAGSRVTTMVICRCRPATRRVWPALTVMRFVPMSRIWSRMRFSAPLPADTMTTTAATPTTMPSTLRTVRSLWAARISKERTAFFDSFIAGLQRD